MENINIKELICRLAKLEADNNDLRDSLDQTMHQVSAIENPIYNATPREPKVPYPEKFNGDRRKFRPFINQLELVFRLNSSRFATDASKVATIGTLLCDKALAWFTPYLEHPDKYAETLDNYSKFRKLLDDTFGEKDRALVAAIKIRKLKQGFTSASNYVAEFQQLATDLEWNDSALIYQLRSGLNDDVKDMLLHHDYPTSLTQAIEQAIQVDNRLYEHRQEKKLGMPPIISSRPIRREFAPAARLTTVPTPMEIDAAHRGPISQAEKLRRREKNLCMYCGSAGHIRANCNLAPRKENKPVHVSSTGNANRQ
jgi:hypothetical protein